MELTLGKLDMEPYIFLREIPFGRPGPERPGDVKGGIARRKMYGSMSSLPSVSSIGSRHLYGKDKRKDDRKNRTGSKDKNYAKRFQRLESHVVTLARSVAHLSSEMTCWVLI